MHHAKILTQALAIISLLAILPSAHAASSNQPITLTTRLVYPNGKPAVDALAVMDLVDSKTKTVTTFTYKPDSTGRVTLTVDPSKFGGNIPVLYIKSPTGFGLFWISPQSAVSVSTLQPFTSVRVRLIDAAGKPIRNERVFPYEFSQDNESVRWSQWIPGPWNQTTDSNGYANLPRLPQNIKLFIDVADDSYAPSDRTSMIQLAAAAITPDATVQLSAGAAISGSLQFLSKDNSPNKPIAGLEIEARPDSSAQARFGTTDETGSYTITKLGPGPYSLIVMDPHKIATNWLQEPQSISVQAGINQSNINISMIHGGLISGKVTDKVTGKPVPNIMVFAPGHGTVYGTGDRTNAGGLYSFHILPGANDLHLTIPFIGRSLSTPQHFDIAEGETKTIDFQIDTPILPAAVQGTVLNSLGKPIPGAEVDAIDQQRGIITLKTDSSGRFTFDSPGLMPNVPILARAGDLATSEAYAYRGQKAITLRLTPGTLCSLTGLVTDKNGAPVPNAPVRLSLKLGDTGYPLEQTVTDTNGRYTFPHAYGNATYMLVTDPLGFAEGNSEDIKTATNQTIQVPVVALTITNSFVGGTLLDAKGSPIANATISDNWRQNVNTKTDQSGHFMLKGLPSRQVVLTIQTDDNRAYNTQQKTGHDGVTLYMPAPVNGLVLGSDDKPVAGAKISAQVNERGVQTFTTDLSGRFTIDSPGLMRNSALMAHFGNLGTAVPVFYKGEDLTLRLTPGKLCAISGQIINTDGTPVSNIAVSLVGFSPILNGVIEDTQTDANGHYTFDPIYSNTKYCVEPSASGYNHPNSDEFNPGANQSVQVPTLTVVLTDAFAGGTVVDDKGHPVANVNVTDQDTGTGATTDQSGHFMLKGVPRGKTYVAAVSPQDTYGDQTLISNRGDNVIYLKKLDNQK